jgi:hypothetical protein
MELRDDDAFWAARRVAAFTDEQIRSAVRTGEFSDPAAERYLVDVLIKRRDKIASVYLNALNPIVAPRLDVSGVLTFENAAVTAGVATPASSHRASWFHFDNATGQTRPLAETVSSTAAIQAPSALPSSPGTFVAVAITAESPQHRLWEQPIRTYFQRETAGWRLVGLERMPVQSISDVRDTR